MVRKTCGHQAIEDDPHPYCDICAVDLRGGLCTKTDTCRNCVKAQPSTWAIINSYRDKREVRKKAERIRHLDFLHQSFGYFDDVDKPTVITAQAALDAARALIARAETGEPSSSSSSNSDSSSLDETAAPEDTANPDNFVYSSDTDQDTMGSKKKGKEVKEPSAQSKANAAGHKLMTEADAAARMKYLQHETQQMKAFMNAKSAADVPLTPPVAPVAPASQPKIRSPPPVSRSHRLSQTRDVSRKRKSRSASKHRTRKARSPDSTSPKKKPRSSSRSKRSTSHRRKRSASDSGSRKRKQKSASRSQSRGSKRRHTRSDSRQKKASKKHKKRYSYSRSPSSDSSDSSSGSSRHSSRRRRGSKRRSKRDKRRYSRHSRDRSRDRSRRSRSPRKSLQQQRNERDNDLRGQRSPQQRDTTQHEAQQRSYGQQEFNQSLNYGNEQSTNIRQFDSWADDYAPPSDDSDAEREIIEPKQDSFPFRDVIEILAKNSDVSLADPAQGRGLQFSMASDEVTGPVKPEFAALTTTKGIKSAVALWEAEFLRKDTKRKKPVRKRELFKCDKLRSSLRSYKSGDTFCNMDPLRHERQPYSWLAEPTSKMEILQTDMAYMELQMRNILRVVNFMEVVNQTVNAGFEQKFDEPTMKKLHRCNKHATGDIIKLAANMFCGIATLRKDELLGRSQKIPEKLTLQLRHAPIGDAQTLLPDEMLAEIDEVYTHRLSNTTLERAAYASQRGSRRGGFQNYQGNYQGGNRAGRGHANPQWNQSESNRGQHAYGFNANR